MSSWLQDAKSEFLDSEIQRVSSWVQDAKSEFLGLNAPSTHVAQDARSEFLGSGCKERVYGFRM